MRRLAIVLPLLLASCAKKPGVGASTAPSASSAQPPAPTASIVAVAVRAAWPDDVRRGRFAAAKEGLDALSDEAKKQPEIRLARAYVAHKLGDDRGAVALLDGLDVPAVRDAVRRLRAEAQLAVGPFDAAAAFFEDQGGAKNLLLAGRAYDRAGRREDARRAFDRAVSAAKGATEIEARKERMRVAEARGDRSTAESDARWLAEKAPDFDEALAVLERVAPTFVLSGREREARAEKLAAQGHGDKALAELALAAKAPGAATGGEARHIRGMVLFKARRYAEAAEVLAAADHPPTAEDDELHAARALSRAHRDAEAIPRYDAIVKKRGAHADEAEYLAARLTMLLGRTDEARGRYEAFLRHTRRAKDREHAQLELSLVELEAAPKAAQRRLAKLADDEDNKLEQARLRELSGVAALAAGDADGAAAVFVQVVRDQPMSFAALAARARLRAMGREAPPLVDDAPPGDASSIAPSLPTGPSLLRALGLEADAESTLRAQEKDLSSGFGSRAAEVMCGTYGLLEPARQRFKLAQRDVSASLVMRAPGPSNGWAWRCLFPEAYASLVGEIEAREKLPKGLVHAVMRQESSFDPEVVSPAHAVGLMQLLPSTAREVAKRSGVAFVEGSLTDPNVNVDLGARYLSLLLQTWKGNVPLAVASYNAGPKAVSSWLAGAKSMPVDLFVARIPYGETRVYVGRVLANQARYAYLAGGPGSVPTLDLGIADGLAAPDDAF